MWYNEYMEEILSSLAELGRKGWTLAAIADELGVARYTVDRWRKGIARPAGIKGTKVLLQQLLRRKRIPKQRRYGESAPSV